MLKRTLLGTLLLAGLSLLLLAGLAAYVKVMQPHPPADAPVGATVERDILWPGEKTSLVVGFRPVPAPGPVQPQEPIRDLVLLIDTSGSMTGEPLREARRAAIAFLKDIGARGQGTRVSVYEFADTAVEVIPPSTDIDAVSEAIARFDGGAGGGTAFLPALNRGIQVLGRNDGGVAVLLSDGEANEGTASLRVYYERTWRPTGHELFLLGIDDARMDNLLALTDEPGRYVLSGLDPDASASLFQETAVRLRNLFGVRGRLQLPFSEPLVRTVETQDVDPVYDYLTCPDKTSDWCSVPILFPRPYLWSMPFEPRIGGVLRVLHDPIRIEYGDRTGAIRSLGSTQSSPLVLALTPAFLAALFAPALLYLIAGLIAWWLRPRALMPESPFVLTPRRPLPPPALARHVLEDAVRVRWTPTLLLGLGRSGLHVLTHLRQALEDTHDLPDTRPILLAMDVARDELQGPGRQPVPACLSQLPDESLFLLPEEACRLHERIAAAPASGDPAAELDLAPYRDFGSERLSLRTGTQGEAPLARLALLNDLAQGADSALRRRLEADLARWRALDPDAPERQLILVFNAEGGIGRGWIADLLILLRHLVAADEGAGVAVEILVVLLGHPGSQDRAFIPLRQDVLADELDRLASAGRLPFRHRSGGTPGGEDAGGDLVRRRPQDGIYVMTGERSRWEEELFPTAAETLLVLMDGSRRRDLLGALQGLEQEAVRLRARQGVEVYTEVSLRVAAFPQSFYRQLLSNRLTQILLGKEVLFPGMTHTEGTPSLSLIGNTGAAVPEPGSEDGGVTPALLSLAAGGPFAPPEASASQAAEGLRDEVHQLLLALQRHWRTRLQAGEWNLATLVQAASGVARHLTATAEAMPASEPSLREAVAALDNLSWQALSWVALLLGNDAARELASAAGTEAPEETKQSLLERAVSRYASVRSRLEEWSANPARRAVAASVREDPGAAAERELLQRWMSLWLGTGADPIAELRRRCQWELTLPGPRGRVLGLQLRFLGSTSIRLDPEEADALPEVVEREVSESLSVVMETQLLPLLAAQMGEDPKQVAGKLATDLKGGLKGDRATLFVSVPGRRIADSPEAEQVRTALGAAIRERTGAAEIVRLHESEDAFRLIAWRMQPLRQAPPRQRQVNPQTPVHRFERYRRDYGRSLARALGMRDLNLPVAAGIALDDEPRLTAFAGLWLAGRIERKPEDGLFHLRGGERDLRLTLYPEEGLADAAARFVTGVVSTRPEGPVPACDPRERADAFEALLCWLWTRQSGLIQD